MERKLKNRSFTKAISQSRILIVDDHKNIRLSLRVILEQEGSRVEEAESVKTGLASINSAISEGTFAYDLVLLDLRMPDGSGLEILRDLSQRNLAKHVIVISGEGSTAEAFQATQMGAFDYIEKPFTPERILVSVKRALEFNGLSLDLERTTRANEMLGSHPRLQEIQDLIHRVGPTNGRVLITGESGTGKELVARAIHKASNRVEKPMIKVNCAAIPHGLMESELFGHEKGAFTGAIKTRQGVFERSHEGTLFLDEIGELSLELQSKLLRVLQNGEFTRVGGEKIHTCDVRLIAATNKDLKEKVTSGEFREDLYYRLNVVTIQTPPLRERKSDIPVLADAFLKDACEEHSLGERHLSERALQSLKGYSWPGNIRELKNLIERSAILADEPIIDQIEELEKHSSQASKTQENSGSTDHSAILSTTDQGGQPGISLNLRLTTWEAFHETVEREFLRFALNQTKGNVSEAARVLELERAYLHRLLKKLGIQRDVNYS